MNFSKILTYALNAYLDAQIAEELVQYVKSNGKKYATEHTAAQKRAEKFVKECDPAAIKKDLDYIIGVAYTQYYINGLMDILYPDLLWPFLVSNKKATLRGVYQETLVRFRKQFTTSYQFEALVHRFGIQLWYWPLAVTNPWRWAQQFAKERFDYTEPLDRKELIRASLTVQRHNIQSNLQVAAILRNDKESDDPKVMILRQVSKQMADPKRFLLEAAETQEAAARWDRIFVWMATHFFL